MISDECRAESSLKSTIALMLYETFRGITPRGSCVLGVDEKRAWDNHYHGKSFVTLQYRFRWTLAADKLFPSKLCIRIPDVYLSLTPDMSKPLMR